jgi:hypothetical protein
MALQRQMQTALQQEGVLQSLHFQFVTQRLFHAKNLVAQVQIQFVHGQFAS